MWHDTLASGLLTLCELVEVRRDEELCAAELPSASDPALAEQSPFPVWALANVVPGSSPTHSARSSSHGSSCADEMPSAQATSPDVGSDAGGCCEPRSLGLDGRRAAALRARRSPQNANPVAVSATPRNLRSKTPSSADNADGAMGSARSRARETISTSMS